MTPSAPSISCWFKRVPDSDWEQGSAYAFEAAVGGAMGPCCIISSPTDGATLALPLSQVALTAESPTQLKEQAEKAAAEKAEKDRKEAAKHESDAHKHAAASSHR